IWFKRLATLPPAFLEAPCCRAPLLPLWSRDIVDAGLICLHCGETAVPFDELPGELQKSIRAWAEKYAAIHKVAHWDDAERKHAGNYDAKFEDAATKAEKLLGSAGKTLVPALLDHYPAVVWEDQDECLEVRAEDVQLKE